jgi:hypothetical protein
VRRRNGFFSFPVRFERQRAQFNEKRPPFPKAAVSLLHLSKFTADNLHGVGGLTFANHVAGGNVGQTFGVFRSYQEPILRLPASVFSPPPSAFCPALGSEKGLLFTVAIAGCRGKNSGLTTR